MKVGIVADSHDNIPMIKKAIEVFNARKVEYLLHAGDYISPFAVKEFLKAEARLLGVFGNNDGEKKGIGMLCNDVYNPPYQTVLGGKKILLTHDVNNLEQDPPISLAGAFDVVIFGHTHKPEVRFESASGGKEKPLYINPGECGGWLSGKGTVSILDLERLEAEIITL
ncbi:MAG TPA: metallophosphoesterase [Candidatus Brocadiia bacterium]